MDVRYSIGVLWDRALPLLAAASIAAVVAFFASSFLPQRFESRATLLVGQPSGIPPSGYEELLAAQILASTYAEIGATTPVLEAARAASGVEISLEAFDDSVRVEALRNSPLLEVVCESGAASSAAQMCNALAAEMEQLGAEDGDQLRLVIIDPAEPAREAVAPRPLVNATLAGISGAVLAASIILLLASSGSSRSE